MEYVWSPNLNWAITLTAFEQLALGFKAPKIVWSPNSLLFVFQCSLDFIFLVFSRSLYGVLFIIYPVKTCKVPNKSIHHHHQMQKRFLLVFFTKVCLMDGWMGVGGWVSVNAVLKIAYSHQKYFQIKKFKLSIQTYKEAFSMFLLIF